jgi:hypothetical protein
VVTRARIDRVASAVIFAGLLALIVDMFLGWVKVTVYSTGLFDTPLTLDMHLTGSGWAGWGIVGGFLAIVLVFWHARSIKRRTDSVGGAAVTAALAAAVAGFTIWHALTGETDVTANGTLFITVTRLWPAEAAIGMTAAVFAAAATRLVTVAAGVKRRASGTTGESVETSRARPPSSTLSSTS